MRARTLLLLLPLSLLLADCRCAFPLKLKPQYMEPGQVDEYYRWVVLVDGNRTPVGGIHLKSGKLPPGLELRHKPDANSATVQGTPTTTGTYSFVLRAWCHGTNLAGQTTERRYSLTVQP